MIDYRRVWTDAVQRELVPRSQIHSGQAQTSIESLRVCTGVEAIGYESSDFDAVRAVVEQQACIDAVVELAEPGLSRRLLGPLMNGEARGGLFPAAWDPDEACAAEASWGPERWTQQAQRFTVCLARSDDGTASPGLRLIEIGNDPQCWSRDELGHESLVVNRVAASHALPASLRGRRRAWLVWMGAGSLGAYKKQLEDIVRHARTRRASAPQRDVRHRIVDVHVLIEGARLLLQRALIDQQLSTALCALAIEDVRASLSSLRRHASFSDPEPAGIECCSGLAPSLAYDQLLREVSS